MGSVDNSGALANCEGEAIFLEWQGVRHTGTDNLWELRRRTMMALLKEKAPQKFVVADVIDYFPDMVNMELDDIRSFEKKLDMSVSNYKDEPDDVFSCVLLWDAQLGEGALIHRQYGVWLAAAYPALDKTAVERERQTAKALSDLSAQAEGISIRLNYSLRQGRHTLSEILDILAKQIVV